MHTDFEPPLTGDAGIDDQIRLWLMACEPAEKIINVVAVSGGSINRAHLLETHAGRTLFLKSSLDSRVRGSFATEAMTLEKLRAPGVVEVPEPLLHGENFLLTTAFIEGSPVSDWQELMGRALARLHLATTCTNFGFDCDNRLGFSLQTNPWCDNWIVFWRENRLKPQLAFLEAGSGIDEVLVNLGYKLFEQLDQILSVPEEQAVLLHGDLWPGNASATAEGRPVIFDPASYYGHREAEFGMMRMFGGFDSCCEGAYQEVWPFAPESERRIAVYRLYHELNHLILFGGSYYKAALSTLRSVL